MTLTTAAPTPQQPISRQDRDRSIAYATRQITRYEQDLAATDCSTECGIAHVAVVQSVLASLEQQLDTIRHRPVQD